MADENRPASGSTTIQRNPQQTPSGGIGAPRGIGPGDGGGMNPQNLNRSPSPGGDGVQSSSSERAAAGLDTPVNQPGQQRVNAAERRERAERTQPDDKAGLRPGLVQSPGEVLPAEASANAINAAELARQQRLEAEHQAQFATLPQSTLDEITAGREALKRHARSSVAQATAPTGDRPSDQTKV